MLLFMRQWTDNEIRLIFVCCQSIKKIIIQMVVYLIFNIWTLDGFPTWLYPTEGKFYVYSFLCYFDLDRSITN